MYWTPKLDSVLAIVTQNAGDGQRQMPRFSQRVRIVATGVLIGLPLVAAFAFVGYGVWRFVPAHLGKQAIVARDRGDYAGAQGYYERALKLYTEHRGQVMGSGATVEELLADLAARFPLLAGKLFDESGVLRRFVTVCVNGERVALRAASPTRLCPGDAVSLLVAIAGG